MSTLLHDRAPAKHSIAAPCRVAIIEDFTMFREALLKHCARELGLEVVGAASGIADAIPLLVKLKPDVVLTDIQLADGEAFEIVDAVRQTGLAPAFVAISSHCDEYTVFRAENAKFLGWIDKGSQTLSVIKETIAGILNGRPYFSQAFRMKQAERRNDPHSFARLLSEWEQKILALIGHCLTDEEIGLRLDIATSTVKRHRSTIMSKLGIPTTPKLIHYAATRGFVRF